MELAPFWFLYYFDTMAGLNIRNLSPEVIEALKRRAKRHHRSLHGELHAILEDAANLAPPPPKVQELALVFARHTRGDRADWRRTSIYGDDGR